MVARRTSCSTTRKANASSKAVGKASKASKAKAAGKMSSSATPRRRCVYRSGSKRGRSTALDDDAMEQALHLLSCMNDTASLSRARAPLVEPHLQGKPTWAGVGALVTDTIAARLLTLHSEAELERTAADAHELHARLLVRAVRDASVGLA